MATVISNATQIPPPRMQLLDPRTGLVTREWYLWFLNLYNLTGGGSNSYSIQDLLIAPLVTENAGQQDDVVAADQAIQALEGVQSIADSLGKEPGYPDFNNLISQVAALELSPLPQPSPLVLYSGVYTPSLTAGANIATATAFESQYLRVGQVVTVSGRVRLNLTAGSTDSVCDISLPISSNFSSAFQCAGSAASSDANNSAATVFGETTGDTARLRFISFGTGSHDYYYQFTYRII